MLTARIAGCAFAVRVSVSCGPSKQRRAKSKPSACPPISKSSRASGTCSQKSRPIPTRCEPWPGKTSAILVIAWEVGPRSPSDQGRTPGQASPKGDHKEQVAWLKPPCPDRFIEGNRNRSRRGVAEAVDIDDDPLPRQT